MSHKIIKWVKAGISLLDNHEPIKTGIVYGGSAGILHILGTYALDLLGSILTACCVAASVYFLRKFIEKKWPNGF